MKGGVKEIWSAVLKEENYKHVRWHKQRVFTKCHKELLSSRVLILWSFTAIYTAPVGRYTSHSTVLTVPEDLWLHHGQEHGCPGVQRGAGIAGYTSASISHASTFCQCLSCRFWSPFPDLSSFP